MGCNVFANDNEVSCKASDGKVIAAFPDVCNSPPSPPAGPIPIPYPVTSMASDTTDGSTTVKINGQPIMLKDQSYFSKCTGDEAATKGLGMGLVSHQITGKVYFTSWSMDVKVEGQNVDRHLDRMTSNHGSPTMNVMDLPEMANMHHTGRMVQCKCSYTGVRDECESRGHGTPNSTQQPLVDNKSCWRPGCRTPNLGPMIVDHQPSLVERWYRLGGCAMAPSPEAFCKFAASTSYRSLKPRCRGCYANIYNHVDPNQRVGRKRRPEMSIESTKGSTLQKKQEEKFGTAPAKCY
jgi:hypothetical protein